MSIMQKSETLYVISSKELKQFGNKLLEDFSKSFFLKNNTNNSSSIIPLSQSDKLTQKEAAKFLGVSIVTLIGYAKNDQNFPVHYTQPNKKGRVFYYKSELLNYTRKNKKA